LSHLLLLLVLDVQWWFQTLVIPLNGGDRIHILLWRSGVVVSVVVLPVIRIGINFPIFQIMLGELISLSLMVVIGRRRTVDLSNRNLLSFSLIRYLRNFFLVSESLILMKILILYREVRWLCFLGIQFFYILVLRDFGGILVFDLNTVSL